MRTKYIAFLLLSQLFASIALSQGAAAILPLSKGVSEANDVISFYIHNLLEEALTLTYTPICDIDGKEFENAPCLEAFSIVFDAKLQENKFTLEKGKSMKGEVRLNKSNIKFAIFKPLFKPVLSRANAKANTIQFNFGYQPGYLFLIAPSKEHLTAPSFDTYVVKDARRARLKFDLTTLSAPQIVSVSLKLNDRKTKKLVRFVRVASQKIVDPRRVSMDLEDEFAPADDKTNVCYEAVVQNISAKDLYQLSNCQ
jgi:hypothetical protein